MAQCLSWFISHHSIIKTHHDHDFQENMFGEIWKNFRCLSILPKRNIHNNLHRLPHWSLQTLRSLPSADKTLKKSNSDTWKHGIVDGANACRTIPTSCFNRLVRRPRCDFRWSISKLSVRGVWISSRTAVGIWSWFSSKDGAWHGDLVYDISNCRFLILVGITPLWWWNVVWK